VAAGVAADVGGPGLTTVGLIIASRRPTNPLGWLLLSFGLSLSANQFLRAYADYTLLYRPGILPAGLAIAWVATWVWAFIFPILPFVFLLFPDGGLPSPHWRPFAWVAGLVNGLFALMVPFRAGGLEYFPAIPNPVGIPALTEAVFEAFAFVTFIIILLTTISLPVRFRRARGDDASSSSGWRTPRSFLESWELSRRDGLPPWSA
jgi:two-component system, NarL family, sensor kinase